MAERRTILVTGGGTGGHVFPGLALAEALRREDASLDVVWVGTRGRVEETAVPAAGLPIEFVDVAFLKGRRGLVLVGAIARMPTAAWQAARLVARYRPVAVVGVGGFASGPVGAVAAALGRPTFVLEQNAVPGATNRLLARVADTVYASFESSRASFGSAIVKVLGNPVRRELLANAHRRRPGGRIEILVIGGSQGARVLNEAVPGLIAELRGVGVDVGVRHAAGKGNAGTVAAAYSSAGVTDARVDEFIDDMAAAYSDCDFVVGRAGATTIAELTAIGMPSLLVPFARAADDHQTKNALAVVEAGGAVMIPEHELDAGRGVRLLGPILGHPDVLDRMAAAARRIGRPDAADAIARDILEQIV